MLRSDFRPELSAEKRADTLPSRPARVVLGARHTYPPCFESIGHRFAALCPPAGHSRGSARRPGTAAAVPGRHSSRYSSVFFQPQRNDGRALAQTDRSEPARRAPASGRDRWQQFPVPTAASTRRGHHASPAAAPHAPPTDARLRSIPEGTRQVGDGKPVNWPAWRPRACKRPSSPLRWAARTRRRAPCGAPLDRDCLRPDARSQRGSRVDARVLCAERRARPL
jgi:hypothetical protein